MTATKCKYCDTELLRISATPGVYGAVVCTHCDQPCIGESSCERCKRVTRHDDSRK